MPVHYPSHATLNRGFSDLFPYMLQSRPLLVTFTTKHGQYEACRPIVISQRITKRH